MTATIAFACTLLVRSEPAPAGPADTDSIGVVVREESDPTVVPDPKKFSRGFFAEGATGISVPIGPTQHLLSPGFALTGRMGYEIRRWIALQVHASGSVSHYDDGILEHELLQQYYYTGEARFGIPIRRITIAFFGGAGLYHLSSNLLQVGGVAPDNALFGFAYDAGLGLDFHSLNRHFSAGIVATFVGMPELDHSGSILAQVYLRYTL